MQFSGHYTKLSDQQISTLSIINKPCKNVCSLTEHKMWCQQHSLFIFIIKYPSSTIKWNLFVNVNDERWYTKIWTHLYLNISTSRGQCASIFLYQPLTRKNNYIYHVCSVITKSANEQLFISLNSTHQRHTSQSGHAQVCI